MYEMYPSTSDSCVAEDFDKFKAEGENLYRHRQYEKAVESLSKALEYNPTECECLVIRSKCYLQIGETEKSLEDANNALVGNETFHKGIYQKAEALYNLGDFEMALVFYHRGHRLRPQIHEFRLGIQKAQEAIVNACGYSQVKLTKDGDLSFFKTEINNNDKGGYAVYAPNIRSVHGIQKGWGALRKKVNLSRQDHAGSIEKRREKTVKTLLGELYGDKVFLEELLNDPSACQLPRDSKISDVVCGGLKFLNTRTDFWRQQKPIYARKLEHQELRRKFTVPGTHQYYAYTELERIDEALSKAEHHQALKRAQTCLMTVQTWTEKQCPRLFDIKSNLHSQIGNAYLELDNFKMSLHHFKQDRVISHSHNIDDGKSRSLANIGRVYAKTGKFMLAIQAWEEKLPMVKTAIEHTWIFHELGRCYLELKKYEEARLHGEKSLASAREASDDGWCMNAWVLLAQCHVKMGDYKTALEAFQEALTLAKKEDDEVAVDAICRAVDEIRIAID